MTFCQDLVERLKTKSAEFTSRCQKIEGATTWYHRSYAVILSNFGASRACNSPEPTTRDQILRTLLVSSWVPTILWPGFTEADLKNYVDVTKSCRAATLSSFNDSDLLKITGYANKLLNLEARTPNIPTVSKLLHFDMPLVFPILDRKLATSLFKLGTWGSPTLDYYRQYIRCLKDLEPREKLLWQKLDSYAQSASVPTLRFIDTLLFDSLK